MSIITVEVFIQLNISFFILDYGNYIKFREGVFAQECRAQTQMRKLASFCGFSYVYKLPVRLLNGIGKALRIGYSQWLKRKLPRPIA